MKVLILLASALFYLPGMASAEKFTVVYKDKSSLSWSQPFIGGYNNGCENMYASTCTTSSARDEEGNPIVGANSETAKICRQIGGRLPTIVQYHRLIREFEHSESGHDGPVLTKKGFEEIQSVFGGNMEYKYWVASTWPSLQIYSWWFARGRTVLDVRYKGYAVRCVR